MPLWNIVIFARTTKTEGDIKLRFRLTDGRRADLYHKSNIKASLADLSKFNVDGSLRPKVSVYNKELEDSITREIDAMRRAYRKMVEAGGIITAVKFEEEVAKELNPEVIIRKEEKTLLSVLHKYIEDPLKRAFYEIEAINGCWTTDELDRQINSLYFERSGMSKNKEALAALVNKQAVKLKPTDVLHDPVALEFLETEKKSTWTEKDLEDAIVGHLQEFLLEMGNGFCFEFRQKRILIDSDYFKADLIFYHRILKCHVIIDVKIDRFRHEYASQMNTYLNYYKYEVMQPGDNPPVGLLLCTGKGDTLVKYATAGLDQNIFVQKYMVSLPSVDDLTTYVADETKKEILRLSAPSTKSMNTTRFSANRPDWHWPQASPG